MSTDTRKWTVDDYLAHAPTVGLSPANFVPSSLRSLCATVAQRNVPTGAPSTFVTTCTASLIIRGILYFKSNPGDCPVQSPIQPSAAGQAEGVAVGIASMAGASLPGIGAFVDALNSLVQHHQVAVANEQAVICGVAGIINQVFAYYDAQVRNGNISPSTAYAGIQTYIAQVTGRLDAIIKTCNASCVYVGILKAHADFVQSYYPAIAPVQVVAHAPGAPPATTGTAPGGVITVGGAALYPPAPLPPSSGAGSLNSPAPPHPQVVQPPAVIELSNTTLFVILAVVAGLFVVVFIAGKGT